MITNILIIIGVIMGISFLLYVFFLLIDHFAYVEGYESKKDPIKILKKIFGYLFVISLISFFIINILGWIGIIH